MTDSRTVEAFPASLREQIRRGFTIAQQYLTIAVYFDSLRLPRLAAQCYRRQSRHRENALRIVQYLLDRDLEVHVGGLDEPRSDFESPRAAVAVLLADERAYTDASTMLVDIARTHGDRLGEQFAEWFLREQLENVADITTLLAVLDREGGTLFDVEEFAARDLPAPGNADPAAPRMAGAGITN